MILFYLLSFISIFSGILLVTNRNPVYSVFNLVVLFICGSLLLLFLGIDFLPFVFVVVYVGAVAVLFLFVVIILDIKLPSKTKRIKEGFIIFFVCCSIFSGLDFFIKPRNFYDAHLKNTYYNLYSPDFYNNDDLSNLNLVGQVLYQTYFLHFVIAGLVLLVAIVGAIVLTSRQKNK